MKRTNLMIDEKALKEATRLMGVKTYSEAVNKSLYETLRVLKIQDIFSFAGSGIWEGDLNQARQERTSNSVKPKNRRK
jgi:hypothetical protein